ncbi:5664_t:CDS:2 [Diversispora eburnea]|uniref:5664_t:CDS:1 n=1 Tax=Diversispora eburnea TaxID=1213867 RepID=A0A9N8UVF4_9GLOM|nr:5664_t:CDS:2 [Diversispora eburnea]
MFPSESTYTKLNQEHSDHSIDEDIISIGSVEEFLESIELQTSQFLKNKPDDENTSLTSPRGQNTLSPPTHTSLLNMPHVKSPSQASKYKIEVPIELNSPQPASIYLETPPPIPQQQANNTLREGLLPSNPSSILDHYPKSSIFSTIKDCAGLIIFTIFFSTIAGILWIASLRLFVKIIIYGITIGVPLCCTTLFVWALNQSLTRESKVAQDYW